VKLPEERLPEERLPEEDFLKKDFGELALELVAVTAAAVNRIRRT
jgi:hypothetical protein